MERRAFLAIILSLGVLLAYQAFMPKPPKPPAGAAANTSTSAPAAASPVVPSTVPAEAAAPTAAVPTEPGAVAATSESETRIETRNVIAVFTNRGARLKSWQLKQYRDGKGQPLDLIPGELAATQPLPFTLKAADDATTTALNSALYTVRNSAADVSGPISSVATLVFEFKNGDLAATKTITIDPAAYTVTLKAQVAKNGVGQSVAILWGPGLGDTDAQASASTIKPGGLFSSGGKVTRLTASNINKQPNYQQAFEYAGIDDHYFAAFALNPGAAAVQYSNLSLPPTDGSKVNRDFVAYSITPPSADQTLTFYVGPKDFDTLASIDRNLTKAINFGMFSVLVVPLLRTLQWVHTYIGNYGWAIVILTVLINLVLFPLNHKSVVSMRKMQEIQPEAKSIQERYSSLKATDPARQKMNQELMALYKKHGVNPASGCIPILLTLPVFLAFYALLQTAIELRGAPFAGWITDLSMPDPYYVLPVLVALSQFATQWMTPNAGMDPAQQRMMMIMPLILGFMFVRSPAGALIYWFVGAIWRIGQMQLTNYMIGPPNVRAVRPAAERRVKTVGQGRTDAAAREEKR